jgi:serine/threonine-protein kinase
MPLSVGDKLGPYEIVSAIGKGGMGEVWRARDPRLGRDVAIKISAQQFTDRFEREARAIAALNHSNICTLYDVGPNYLVMEFVEGATLADRITQGPIPLDEALAIAKQIADALEAAHEKGIVHRDLKPANVKIKPDGSIKVLDFGLAKSAESVAVTPDSPTMTLPGMILGTAAYMSPEQARGKEVDKRADIWAFGMVLYEMVTGKRLFQGQSVSDTLAAVTTQEPDWSRLPAKVQRLLRRCLEKDPKRRLRDISGVELLLEEDAGHGATSALWPAWIAALAALVAIALGIAFWAPWRAEKPPDRQLTRLDVDLGADVSLPAPNIGGSDVAISPDGTRLAFVSGTPTKLFSRRVDQPKARELPGTEGASLPFFSPDGQWVGFYAGGKLNKISVEGGAVVPLGDIAVLAGASWGEDGSIFLSEAGLLRIPAGGGTPETIAAPASGEIALNFPQILPGGKAILFVGVTTLNVDKLTIEVLTLADRHRKIVALGGNSPRYLATSGGAGHLVYVSRGTLFAVPFDLDKLKTRGTAVPVLDDVAIEGENGAGQYDFSRTGTMVYRRSSGGTSGMKTLQWLDPAGRKEPLRAKPGAYQYPNLSPDGKRVALTVAEGGSRDVWVYDPQRDAMTRLTSGGAIYADPVWSPDGHSVVFASYGNGIFQARADGSGQPDALTQSKTNQIPWSFTPDGKRLAYFEIGKSQIWTMPVEVEGGQLKAGKPEQFLESNFDDNAPAFSPDGRWLAYYSNESGRYEVYVRAFPQPSSGQGGKWQVSNSGGTTVRWSRHGHELMYQSGDQIMAVSYTVKGDTFVSEKPRVWIAKLGGGTHWDLAPDGKHVAVVTPVESAKAPTEDHEVVFLLNFFDELRRRVPPSK